MVIGVIYISYLLGFVAMGITPAAHPSMNQWIEIKNQLMVDMSWVVTVVLNSMGDPGINLSQFYQQCWWISRQVDLAAADVVD